MSDMNVSTKEMLQENLLSSTQLFARRKPGEKSLPKKGVKDYSPDGSWLHQRRLEMVWEERKALLAEKRVEKLGNVVKGEWNPEKDLVELEKELGKFWAYMGFVDHQRKWLLPEEALFLMETSVLEVWYGGVPVSIQQAYHSFLGRCLTFEEYQVYAHLRRLGFVVIRHKGPCQATRYERQIQLDQHTLPKRKRKRAQDSPVNSEAGGSNAHCKLTVDGSVAGSPDTGAETSKRTKFVTSDPLGVRGPETLSSHTLNAMDSPETKPSSGDSGSQSLHTVSQCADSGSPCVKSVSGCADNGSQCTESVSEFADNLSPCVESVSECADNQPQCADNVLPCTDSVPCCADSVSPCADSASGSAARTDKGLQDRKSQFVDFSDIQVPSVFGLQKLILEAPRAGLLPPTVRYPSDRYEVDLLRTPINLAGGKAPQTGQEEAYTAASLEFAFPQFTGTTAYIGIRARNWHEYKSQKHNIDKKLSCVENSPVADLWKGKVTPLVRPQHGESTASILERLSVIKEMKGKPLTSTELTDAPIRVVFDVYQPDSKFKKSTPGTPHFRTYVQRQSDPPPTLAHLTEVTSGLDDDIPVLCAVVDSGDIALYTFTHVSLPVNISMG